MTDTHAANWVLESSTSVGLGPYALGGTSEGFRTFVSGIGNGKSCIVVVSMGINKECILATVTAGIPDQLSRDKCFSSTQGGSFIDWGPGTKTIENVDPAEYFGQQWKDVRAVTAASVTLTAADNATLILYDATGAPGTVNLPAGATVWRGFTIGVKKTDATANAVTSDGNSAETLDGAATRVLTVKDWVEVYVWGGSEWKVCVLAPPPRLANSARTSNTVLAAADHGTAIEVTGASTFTQTFAAASALGKGWWCSYKNSGTGIVTLDPDAAETIDAAPTLALNPGAAAWVYCDGTALRTLTRFIAPVEVPLPRGYLAGFTLANNATDALNDIDIAAGAARAADDSANIVLASAITKRLDAAWAVGTNQGGLDTGAEASGTWYHLWAIKRPDTGVVDVLFSASATAPTMPTNYTLKRRIGAVRNDGSSNILAFHQYGDEFEWDSPPLDQNSAAIVSANRTLYTMSTPLGISCLAMFNVNSNAVAGHHIYFSDPATVDLAPSQTAAPLTSFGTNSSSLIGGGQTWVRTDTSSRIAGRSDTNMNFAAATLKWIDRRGRDD